MGLTSAVLPYNGTSGWSGSEASYDRAVEADKSGTTKDRQADTLGFLLSRREYGATWKELSDKFSWHHGSSSGVLSVLHKAGLVDRLTEKRDRCQVYVAPQFVSGRDTQKQGRLRKPCPHCGGLI